MHVLHALCEDRYFSFGISSVDSRLHGYGFAFRWLYVYLNPWALRQYKIYLKWFTIVPEGRAHWHYSKPLKISAERSHGLTICSLATANCFVQLVHFLGDRNIAWGIMNNYTLWSVGTGFTHGCSTLICMAARL